MNPDKNERGFTLIEILVGITLLAVVIVPMLAFFGNSTRVIYQTDIREKALLIAQQTIEGLKTVDFAELENEATVLNGNLTDTNYPDLGLDLYPVFTREVKISGGDEPNLKKIEVIISWDEGKHDLNLKTKVTKR